MKTGALGEAEYEVHVLDRLTGSAFHEIVDYADHVELTAVFTYIEHTFVRVHDHLQIRIRVDHVHERLVLVVVL